MEQSDADRAAVAREVLTEYADILRDAGQTLSEAEVRRYVREHYPAPHAPETVTVTFRDGSTETLSLRDGKWQSGTGLLYDELIERACLDRIASDARVTQERDARIAELERQGAVIVGDCLAAQHARRKAEAERDAALRALEEYQNGIGPMGSKGKGLGGDSRPNGEAGDKEAPSNPLPPAPIPLGADEKPFDQTMDAKLWAQEFVRRFPAHDEGLMLAWFANAIMRGYDTARAKYEHPVATRETVELVRDAMKDDCLNGWDSIARAALTAAGFTLEAGA